MSNELEKKGLDVKVVSDISSDLVQVLDSSGTDVKANRFKTAFNIMKTIIGAGIFGTPYALKSCGFGFGIILIFVMAIFFYMTMMSLVYSAEKANVSSFQQLVEYCFGKWGIVALNISLLFFTWGFLASYTVILADELPPVLSVLVGVPGTEFMKVIITRRFQVLLVSFLIILPVSLSRSLAGLAKFSGIALAGILFIIGCIIGIAPSVETSYKGNTEKPLEFINFAGVMNAVGIIGFAYACHHNILLNYASLKNATPQRFKGVCAVSVLVTVILTVVIGCAYITFREKSYDNILTNFPRENYIIVVCHILFALDMVFTYPLQLFVFRDSMEKQFFKGQPFNKIRHTIITTFVVASTALVGCLTCNLGVILEITGGVTGFLIALVVPCSCWLRVNSKLGVKLTLKQKLPYYFTIGLGISMMILSVLNQVLKLVNEEVHNKDCGW